MKGRQQNEPTPRRFNVYELFALVRSRPGMWLGESSLTRLQLFVFGCLHITQDFGIKLDEAEPDFAGLHDWVAQRFGWRHSTAGWCHIILHACGGDEAKALEVFFELIEEYRRGAPARKGAPDG